MGNELTQPEVATLLRELLADILGIEDVGLDVDLVEELDAESLQRLELMSDVEHRLDVRLDVKRWRSARTIAELAELALGELEAQRP